MSFQTFQVLVVAIALGLSQSHDESTSTALAIVPHETIMAEAHFDQPTRRFCIMPDGKLMESNRAPSVMAKVEKQACATSCGQWIDIYQKWSELGLSCVVWPAAIFLAEYVLNHLDSSHRILEIGETLGACLDIKWAGFLPSLGWHSPPVVFSWLHVCNMETMGAYFIRS